MFDVIILGLGAMGSSAAYHLASRGRRVLGLEQYGPVHSLGSSHGDSRIIRMAYHESPEYVPLLGRAYELWKHLERDSGAKVLELTGGLMIGRPGSSVVEGAIRSAREHELPHEVWHAEELQRRFPSLRPRADEVALYEREAGFVRPEAAIRAHLDLAARASAELHFEERVSEWNVGSDGTVRVITNRGAYEASRLIVAPGAWAPNLLAQLGVPFEIRRHVMCWFEPVEGAEPFLPERFPIYIWDVDGTEVFYGFPVTSDGGGVKVAMHNGGEFCSADSIRRTVSDEDVEEVRRQLRVFIPGADGALLRAATCMYTMTPDEHFVVGMHPELPQVAIAAGFSGHGFKFCSVLGEILADLVVEGRTQYPIDLFSPTRFR